MPCCLPRALAGLIDVATSCLQQGGWEVERSDCGYGAKIPNEAQRIGVKYCLLTMHPPGFPWGSVHALWASVWLSVNIAPENKKFLSLKPACLSLALDVRGFKTNFQRDFIVNSYKILSSRTKLMPCAKMESCWVFTNSEFFLLAIRLQVFNVLIYNVLPKLAIGYANSKELDTVGRQFKP